MAHFQTVRIFIQARLKSALATALVLYCLTYRLYVNGLLCYYGLIFSQSEQICPCIYFLRFAPVTHDCLAGELIGPLYGICVLQLTKTNRLETTAIFTFNSLYFTQAGVKTH